MFTYNPHAPQVLGEEWVPVSAEPYLLDTGEERGYRWTKADADLPVYGQVMLHAEPTGYITTQVPLVSVYRAGDEGATGPVQEVVVPCDGAVSAGPYGQFVGGSGASVFTSTSDARFFALTSGGPSSGPATGDLRLSFDTSSVAAQLSGMRILNVAVLYTATGDWVTAATGPGSYVRTTIAYRGTEFQYGTGVLVAQPSLRGEYTTELGVLDLGEINPNWSTATFEGTLQRYPWRQQELAHWDAADSDPYRLHLTWSAPTDAHLSLYYCALRITYCNENRYLVGGVQIGSDQNGTQQDAAYVPGTNNVVLRATSTYATGAAMPAGEYTVTACLGDMGDATTFLANVPATSNTRPSVQALRELYALPTLTGLSIRRPRAAGEVAVVTESRMLPYVAVTTKTATYAPEAATVGTHAYGRLLPVPVSNGSSPTQTILSGGGMVGPLPQVRFYARHYGATAPLFLQALSGSPAVAINPTQLDALPEIADGWREVTLRFNDPPSINNSMEWGWYSVAPSGRRWEILAVAGETTNSAANYGTALTWLTMDGAPLFWADAVLMFSQDPPTVSGVGAVPASLALSRLSDCGTPSAAIPAAMPYALVTWQAVSAASIPASGFGGYEVQRQDDVDPTWSTVMNAPSPAVTAFRDWEARVGVPTRYRIRVVNALGFAGAWSPVVSVTLPAPAANADGVWMFTCNVDRFGARAGAWPEAETSAPDWAPAYAEGSGMRTYGRMYGRDMAVASRPVERGEASWSLVLLVGAGAVGSAPLAQAFRRLRDMAWAEWPYVCVRTGAGDRWYAAVDVPGGTVRRRAAEHVQLAQVTITEVSAVPYAVEV